METDVGRLLLRLTALVGALLPHLLEYPAAYETPMGRVAAERIRAEARALMGAPPIG